MRCKDWIAVASAGHARRGPDAPAGLMQVGHGKLAPLGRIAPGDRRCCRVLQPAGPPAPGV
ncbi:hypothetical protein [Polaromonas sp.]|uniref:hypothetical protein n=1 Tax=Polaromonas sp. TaxID=1869339 RepID=UPI003457EC73